MVDWTPEQLAIIDSVNNEDGLYVVDAAAGSGKTTTAIETIKRYVQCNPNKKVLMLVRGKDLKGKLKGEFKGIKNVEVATVHSYAYNRYFKLLGISNKQVEVAEKRKDFFELIGKFKKQDPQFTYVSANLLANLFDDFYSKDQFVTVDSYVAFLAQDRKRLQEAAKSVKVNDTLLDCFHFIYKSMEKNHCYTHDMYIKDYALKYQDRNSFDLVVIDEAQDLNKYMNKLLERIDYKKMYIIGDEHQQMFSWDNCINIIKLYRNRAHKVFYLTKSFRSNANNLVCSNHLLTYLNTDSYTAIPVIPGHNITELPEKYTKATLFCTNAAMILDALNAIIRNQDIKVQFKGFDNTSVKSLFGNRFNYILSFLELEGRTKLKDRISNEYKAWISYTPYIIQDAVNQANLEHMDFDTYLNIYGKYLEPELRQSHRLYKSMMNSPLGIEGCLRLLQENLHKPILSDTIIEEYSTAHRAKGFEWDYVILGKDIWDFDTINGFCSAYVASTRARISCDTSALDEVIERYDEIKEYIDWAPTLNGYDGNLEKDLAIAKMVRYLEDYIPNAKEIPVKYLETLCIMKEKNKLPEDFDYTDIDAVLELAENYIDEDDIAIVK